MRLDENALQQIWRWLKPRLSASVPGHGATHQHGGADEISTASPAGSAIPKAGGDGKLAVGWLPTGSGNGLDADLLDGYHASASPVSNAIPKAGGDGKLALGWLPTGSGNGLNADLLDGKHGSDYITASGGEVSNLTWSNVNEPASPSSGKLITYNRNNAFGAINSDGHKIPLMPAPPWIVGPRISIYPMQSYNPLITLDQRMMDDGYYARHLIPEAGWQGAASFYNDKTIFPNTYNGVNASNRWWGNSSAGSLYNGSNVFSVLMWFYPTTTGALRGLFQYGHTAFSVSAYIAASNSVVLEFHDGTTLWQLVSSNTIYGNIWNYVVFTYTRSYSMQINLNGTVTSRTPVPTTYFRSAVGDFRLGWSAYAGDLRGYLGWFMATAELNPSDTKTSYLISMSRPWHNGGA